MHAYAITKEAFASLSYAIGYSYLGATYQGNALSHTKQTQDYRYFRGILGDVERYEFVVFLNPGVKFAGCGFDQCQSGLPSLKTWKYSTSDKTSESQVFSPHQPFPFPNYTDSIFSVIHGSTIPRRHTSSQISGVRVQTRCCKADSAKTKTLRCIEVFRPIHDLFTSGQALLPD